MYNMSLPWWGWALMGAGLVCFVALVALSVRRNHGVKRSLFASPYTLWMILFTVLPCILVAATCDQPPGLAPRSTTTSPVRIRWSLSSISISLYEARER